MSYAARPFFLLCFISCIRTRRNTCAHKNGSFVHLLCQHHHCHPSVFATDHLVPCTLCAAPPLFDNKQTFFDPNSRPGLVVSSIAGLSTGFVGFLTRAIAEDDYELAELPPPYVPVIFGLVLIVGVGALTASLGDVMEEEASLGLQSGARAKKEIERSRSSYFKR